MPKTNFRAPRFAAWLVALVAIIAFGWTGASVGASAPEPSGKPPRWELKFEIQKDLRLIEIDDEFYWFMTYLVTNRTRNDQLFVPDAVLYADDGTIVREGEGVPLDVVDRLQELLANPLLESSTEIIGTLRQGAENAREGLFVWRAGSLDIDEVALFIAGVSSETQELAHPITGEPIILRKTLERRYDAPGNPAADLRSPVFFRSQRWIMR
ncbi:MAG: hypothetical protein ACF8PN_01490 [Phycisphaerales bacterium]